MPPGKYLADGLPSGCTVSLTGAQYKILTQVNKDMTGAGGRRDSPGPVKREAGERPARSRRCERGVMLRAAKGKGSGCHWEEEPFPAGKGPGLHVPADGCGRAGFPGRRRLAVTLESEDLPAMCAMRPRGIGWRGMRVERARSVLRKGLQKFCRGISC